MAPFQGVTRVRGDITDAVLSTVCRTVTGSVRWSCEGDGGRRHQDTRGNEQAKGHHQGSGHGPSTRGRGARKTCPVQACAKPAQRLSFLWNL